MSDTPPPFPQPSSGGDPANPYGAPTPPPPPFGSLPEPAGGNVYGAPPPPPNWGAAPVGGQWASPISHPRGTLILVFGILSIVCCGIFTGIPAIVMGGSALKQIDANPAAYSNRGIVQAGRICGIVGTVLSVALILVNLAARSRT